MLLKPTYQELEIKIKQLEHNQQRFEKEIVFFKKREQELKFMLNEYIENRKVFLQGKILFLKLKNETGWQIENCSSNIYNLLGYTKQELALKKLKFIDILQTESINFFKQEIKKLCQNDDKLNNQKQIELSLISKNTIVKWVYCQIISVKNEYNKITHFHLMLFDITEQKLIKQDLQKSEEKYRLLFQHAPVGIYIADTSGNILNANPRLLNILDVFTLSEIKTVSILDYKPFVRSGYANSFIKCVKEGKIVENELLYITKTKRKKLLRGQLVPIKNNKGKVIKVFTLIEDITRQREIEKNLKHSEKELKAVNTAKDKFFSIIAHDLRSPVGSILSLINTLILRYYSLDKADLIEYLKIIEQSAQNTFDLLNNLLLWANSQRKKIEFNPINIHLKTLIETTLSVLMNSANEKNIKIDMNIANDISIFADKEMLSVIIRNLISNAIKFTNKGGKVNINAKLLRNKNTKQSVELIVEDTGRGMSDEILNKLFKIGGSFSTKGTDNEQGSGLGLLLCKEFVQMHKGKIHAESKLGKGSRFIVQL